MQPRSIINKARRFFVQHHRKHKATSKSKSSFDRLNGRAMAGCFKSQRALGDHYYFDQIDIDLALYWYDKAALQGNLDAAIMAFSIEANDSRHTIASSLMLSDPQFNTNPPA